MRPWSFCQVLFFQKFFSRAPRWRARGCWTTEQQRGEQQRRRRRSVCQARLRHRGALPRSAAAHALGRARAPPLPPQQWAAVDDHRGACLPSHYLRTRGERVARCEVAESEGWRRVATECPPLPRALAVAPAFRSRWRVRRAPEPAECGHGSGCCSERHHARDGPGQGASRQKVEPRAHRARCVQQEAQGRRRRLVRAGDAGLHRLHVPTEAVNAWDERRL